MTLHSAPFAAGEPDLSLRHLQAELSRIDVLIQRQVRRWQLAGQDTGDAFRGLYVSDADADGLLARPFGSNWGEMAALSESEEAAFRRAEARAIHQAQALLQGARTEGEMPRLMHLRSAFGLDRFELDALLVCLAPALDLRYERLYGYLQDDVTRKRPSANLVLDLLCPPGAQRLLYLRCFADDAPLFRYRLVERLPAAGSERLPLLSQTLVADETVLSWLLGDYHPHPGLGPHAALLWPEPNAVDELLATDVTQLLHRVMGQKPICAFYGPDRTGQEAVAKVWAAEAGRPLLSVALDAAVRDGSSAPEVLHLVLRDARLTGAVPYVRGWDACLAVVGGSFDGDAAHGAAQGGSPPPDMLAELCAHPDLAIVAGRWAWQPIGLDRLRSFLWLEFPVPSFGQRRALWRHYLDDLLSPLRLQEAAGSDREGEEGALVSGEGEGLDLTALAGQFALTSGQIRDAVASARDMAAREGRPLADQDLFASARAYSNPRLGTLARKIVPRYTWEDIVLPADQIALLREIVATVRGRPLVLEEWGVGQKLASSKGVTVLFSGPPGTGKTMGAEVIAADLGLDLFKIDLSTVVSKYIGETEKNLERIFYEAQSSNAILFFDEADAIFGKRSEVKDAHDRYANIEISYLLQRMELYDGVTILATNLRANLDEAFTRRLQFAVDFPFPEEEYRLRIWETLFPPGVPREPDIDFGLLARRFRLAGGSIRNILVSAAYLAAADGQALTMGHLLHGTRRELQKMGRLVNEEDMRLG